MTRTEYQSKYNPDLKRISAASGIPCWRIFEASLNLAQTQPKGVRLRLLRILVEEGEDAEM